MFKSKAMNGRANHIGMILLGCMFLIVFLKSDVRSQQGNMSIIEMTGMIGEKLDS